MRLAGLDVALLLLQTPPRLFQVQNVFLGVDIGEQLVALDLKLGAPHRIARFEQLHLILVIAHVQVRLGLLDLLVDLLHFEQRLFEGGTPLGIVELDDEVFLFGQRAERRELSHLNGGEQVRRDQRHRTHGPQLATGIGPDDYIAAADLGRRNGKLLLRKTLEKLVSAIGGPENEQREENANDSFFHGPSSGTAIHRGTNRLRASFGALGGFGRTLQRH